MSETRVLPVLPLRDIVVFPGVAVPISAGRPKTLQAIEAALSGNKLILAVAQRDNLDEVEVDNLYRMGTVVRLAQVQRGMGGMQLLIQGEERSSVETYEEIEGVGIRAHVRGVEEVPPRDVSDEAFAALYREIRERAEELGKRRGIPDEMLHQFMEGVREPGPFADLLSFYVEADTGTKQSLLETLAVEERLRQLLVIVQRQLQMLSAQEEIQAQVQEELGERQREMLLREQMKAIQRELGEDDEESEIRAIRERVEALDLPATALEEVEREIHRLERTNPQSAEYQVIRTYLDWVTDLPWSARTEDKLDLDAAQRILDEDHYGLSEVKDRVIEFLSVRQLAARRTVDEDAPPEARARATAKGPILLFGGPPGVGKTSIAKSIARALGREYARLALGGIRDEADIRGHRRTYVGAMPGRIIQALKQAKSKNPVILLDEVDKLGISMQGDPSSALLEVLDPAQNHEFTDNYLGVPFDLSEVLFIATANYPQNIPAPLLDRMETVEFRGYTEQEKLHIAQRYLLPRQREEAGLEKREMVVTEDALHTLISEYTREAGVRQLERELGKLARKAARRIAGGDARRVRVQGSGVKRYLGRTRVRPEKANLEDRVGVATGMYYTPAGGDIMFIEVSASPRQEPRRPVDTTLPAEGERVATRSADGGVGSLVLTGQLGDVMKESARAALTYARSHGIRYGLDPRKAWGSEIHVHVPAGAIPKDGPSAGVPLAAALVSALSGSEVRYDVAMTGEITLTGRVLPIGGVKEKVLGAHRAEITTVVLPRANEADLEDLPDSVLADLDVHLVDTIDEALAVALRGASMREGRLAFPGMLLEGSEAADPRLRV